MVEALGGEVAGVLFFIELTDLKGKDKLSRYQLRSLVKI
jgi:adenine phosphoribosyltransferase